MDKSLFSFVGLLLVSWIFGGSYWYASTHCGTQASASGFSVQSGSFHGNAKDNIYFDESGTMMSLDDGASILLKDMVAHLQSNNNSLEIKGQYSHSETDKWKSENLGLQRAEAVKMKLVDLGVEKDRIKISVERKSELNIINGKVYNPITFEFLPRSISKTNQEKVEQNKEEVGSKLDVRKLNLYFPKSTYKLKMTRVLQEYFDEVKVFLKENTSAKIKITGHTDNLGEHNVNMRLSKYRARTVRNFMVDNGFKKSRIIIDYKGPDEPIASNETDEGRTKNRRAEVRVFIDK